MAGVVDSPPNIDGGPLFNDEKINEKGENKSIELASELQGDVYDDTRAIDLGTDGKERPIGTLFSQPAKKTHS